MITNKEREQQILLLSMLEEKAKRLKEQKIYHGIFQKGTKHDIINYPKHLAFINAGYNTMFRFFMAANRVGKTELATFEVACHAIGYYPDWWQGLRFEDGRDLTIFVLGDYNSTIRDILGVKLLGSKQIAEAGTGMIPKKNIKRITRGGGVQDLVDTMFIEKNNGGTTTLQFISYESGYKKVQGVEVDFILLDEEPPLMMYEELATRLLTTKGSLIATFTPLSGITPFIAKFQESCEIDPDNYKTFEATWWDVPHLDEKEINILLNLYPEWQRDARSKGIPVLGSGAIYRVNLDDILVDNFDIPAHWKKIYGLDVGFHNTAAVFGAINPDNGITYIYDELLVHEKQPFEYARMIKDRGDWINGVVDTASHASNQHDGKNIYDLLTDEGLHLVDANKAVDAGIYKTWEGLCNNKIKFFKNTTKELQKEYKMYRRDLKGNIVKQNDHLLDAFRYLIMNDGDVAKNNIKKEVKPVVRRNGARGGWMS